MSLKGTERRALRSQFLSASLVVGALLVFPAAMGATPGVATAQTPMARDLSGFWAADGNQRCNPNCGTRVVAQPQYTAWAQEFRAARRAENAKRPEGEGGPTDDYCLPGRPIGIMRTSAPIHILQTPKTSAILAEDRAFPRHIYTDGRSHPNMEDYDKTINGHSIGRWEGDVFIVETVGLSYDHQNQDELLGFPITDSLRIVERFMPAPDGKKMTIQTTYYDPKVFVTPFVEDPWTYTKLEGEQAMAMEYYCDPRDRDSELAPKFD